MATANGTRGSGRALGLFVLLLAMQCCVAISYKFRSGGHTYQHTGRYHKHPVHDYVEVPAAELPPALQPPQLPKLGEVVTNDADPTNSPAGGRGNVANKWDWKAELVDGEECARRTGDSPAPQRQKTGKAGSMTVVISYCHEDLTSLKELMCTGAEYIVFSRCQHSAAFINKALPRLSKCITVTLADDLTYTQAYLKYIQQSYDELPEQVLFLSLASVRSAALNVKSIVREAGETKEQWAYKGFGEKKRQLSMRAFSELCFVVQRYTCVKACSYKTLPYIRQWYRYYEYSVFLASAERIRSLQKAEYDWLSDFSVRSAAAAGISTPEMRNAMDPLWGFVFGCPQDAGAARTVGCRAAQGFSKGGSSLNPYITAAPWVSESRRALVHEVVERTIDGGDPVIRGGEPTVGIALTFCEEDLEFIDNVDCDGIVFHLYSKCGVDLEQAKRMAPNAAKCFGIFKEVPVTLETELAWPKHHAQYLEHIIQRYNDLEPFTIFAKANLEKRRLSLPDMIREVKDSQWGFYSFGNPKIKVNMTSFPETGNVAVWQREICAMYRRYTGADPCQMDVDDMKKIGFDPYHYNTRSMWSASSTRIRSLPVTEYQWMREYLMSITFEDRVKRRYVPERIWQAMLGCPAELHTRTMTGCTSKMWHPVGQALQPPGIMLADGLVTWPQISAKDFSPDDPYPSFFRIHDFPVITFVGSYVGGMDEELRIVMISILVATAKLHPNCKFMMLTDMDTPETMFTPDMWLGRLEVRRYDVEIKNREWLSHIPVVNHSPISFFQAHGVDETVPIPAWEKDVPMQKWIATQTWARLFLEACFLRDAVAAIQEGTLGHLALMDFTVFLPNNIRPILNDPVEQLDVWHIGLPVRPVEDAPVASSIWYVHKDHAQKALALLSTAVQMVPDVNLGSGVRGESYLDHHSLALSKVMKCCLEAEQHAWWSSRNTHFATCNLHSCGVRSAPELRIRFQPCSQHLVTVGGSFVEECPMELDEPEGTFALKWGFREFEALVYSLFKVKDKSTGNVSVKAAIKDFVTVYGGKHPDLAQRYNDLLSRLIDP